MYLQAGKNCMKIYERFFEEDSSSSIEEILSKNFGKDFAKAIEKGYEGILWDSPVEEFLPEVHGLDILYKTMMVLDGTYRAWDNDFFRYKGDENFFKKYISFLVEIYNKYNLPKLGKNIKKYYKKHKERFRESDSLNWNEVNKFTRSLWDENISTYSFDKNEIESAISKIQSGGILKGGSPEVVVKFKNDKFLYYFDTNLELTTSNKEEVAAYLVIFTDDNGNPNTYIRM